MEKYYHQNQDQPKNTDLEEKEPITVNKYSAEEIGEYVDEIGFGSVYKKESDPSNQKPMNPTPFLPLIPFDVKEDVEELGTVALFFSIPTLYFAKILSIGLQRDYDAVNSWIEFFEERWSKNYDTNQNSLISFSKIIYKDDYVFISVCYPFKYKTGTVVLISANEDITVNIEQYVKEVYEFALKILAKEANLSNVLEKPLIEAVPLKMRRMDVEYKEIVIDPDSVKQVKKQRFWSNWFKK